MIICKEHKCLMYVVCRSKKKITCAELEAHFYLEFARLKAIASTRPHAWIHTFDRLNQHLPKLESIVRTLKPPYSFITKQGLEM